MQASPLGKLLAERSGATLTRGGQVQVEPDCTLPRHPEVFVVGDLMALDHLPGLAEVAMQSGLHAAGEIARRLEGDAAPRRFRYLDLGSLAAVSRFYAIGQRGRIQISGVAGWLVWLVVHLTFLTGFKNRAGALVALDRQLLRPFPGPSGRSRSSRCRPAARCRSRWLSASSPRAAGTPDACRCVRSR